MRTIARSIGITALVLCLGLALLAQDRGTPASGGTSSSAGAASGSSAGSSVATRGIGGGVVSSSSAGGTYTGTSRTSEMMTGGGGGGTGGGVPVFTPRYPVGSSFSPYNYDRSMYFFSWLQSNFWFEMMQLRMFDTSRYYRNREPLITPDLIRMTLREPLSTSKKLLEDVDSLQAMVEELQAGKPINKTAMEAKTQEIRALAKKIRLYQPIAFFDLRKSRDLTKGSENLGLGAIAQLREMALQLNSQLTSMYDQKVTSTVSVNSLNQASFESLSKGIEKLSKVIENSKPRS
jgi:hypothetical protein